MSMQQQTQMVDTTLTTVEEPQTRWLCVDLTIGKQHSFLIANPLLFYDFVQPGIKSMLVGSDCPDCPQEEKRLKQLVRTGIKGLFLTFGNKILDMLFGTPDHPKPQKGDDLIEWYSNIFTQIILTKCTDGILILKGKEAQFGQTSRPIIIDEICTVALASDALQRRSGTGEGDGSRAANTDTAGVQ